MHDDWDSADVDFARVLTAAASSSTRVVTAQVAASGTESDVDSETERGDAVEILQPLGLMAVPAVTSTTQAPFLRMGDQMVGLAIIDKGAPAQAVEAGEVRLYGPGSTNAAAVVRVRANGSIEITSLNNTNVTVTANGTGEVRVNGSAVKIAADTDPVDLGAWTFNPGTGGAALSYTPPGGVSTPIAVSTPVAGKIAVSAARRAKTSA